MKKIISALFIYILLSVKPGNSQNAFYINWDSVAALKKVISAKPKLQSPGYSLLVGYKDSILFTSSAGLRDLKKGLEINDNTCFYVASIAKTFTAAAVLKLRQEKKLDLSDKLINYIPSLPDFMKDIRLFHLLTHSSGLRDYYDVFGEEKSAKLNNKDILEFVRNEDSLQFIPGFSFSYSNTGYVLLSQVIEKASGLSFTKYIQQNLLVPAGMYNTWPYEMRTGKNNQALGYEADSLKNYFENEYKNSGVTGAGGFYSTTGDLHKWLLALKSGKIVPVSSFDLMTSFPIMLTGKKSYLGMGWNNESWGPKTKGLENLKAYGAFGVLGGFRSMIFYLPDNDLHFILLSNTGSYPIEIIDLIRKMLSRKQPLN
jgi:CubicO group peptidase (beta-lactamase class C family)